MATPRRKKGRAGRRSKRQGTLPARAARRGKAARSKAAKKAAVTRRANLAAKAARRAESARAGWRTRRIRTGKNLPPQVSRAYAIRKQLMERGEEPEDIRVFMADPELGTSRRSMTLSGFYKFITEDKYSEARDRMQEEGMTLMLGVRAENGTMRREVESL